MHQDVSDDQLLARVAQHDRSALSDLYMRFQRPLFGYLFHLLGQKEAAEDTLQEVMVIVWQKAHTYHGSGAVLPWVFGIAHHQAFRSLRRGATTRFVELEAALELADNDADPEADALRRVAHDEIAAALACLTPEHREALELAFFQDFSAREIADIVGIPLGTVKSRMSYARRALKAALACRGWEA